MCKSLHNDAPEHVPGLDRRIAPENEVQQLEADREKHQKKADIWRSS